MSKEMEAEFARCRAEIEAFQFKTSMPAISEYVAHQANEKSYLRPFFTVHDLKRGEKLEVDLPYEFESPIWILPGLGYVAQDYVELLAEKANIRMFTVQAAKDWLLRYEREGRTDILYRAAQAVAKALVAYEVEAGWRTIVPAATSSFDGAGVLPPRAAQIFQLPTGDAASGYFSKELINRMIVGASRIGKKLTHVLVSPEDLADIREWTDLDVDPVTRYEIFHARGLENNQLWNVQLVELQDLGVRGTYNINDKYSEFGPFKGASGEGVLDNSFNDYVITNGNVVDNNGNLVVAGETQIYGLCSDIQQSLHMGLVPYEAYYDWTLLRRQKVGFYGWQEMGMGLLDARSIVTGIIDRYYPMSGYTREDWLKEKGAKVKEEEDKRKLQKEVDAKIRELSSLAKKDPELLDALLTMLKKVSK